MPEHLRALIVILILASVGFKVARKLFQQQISDKEFSTWRNAWFVTTVIAFLSGNFWIYVATTTLFFHFITKRNNNRIAIFFILLFVIPPVGQAILGMGLINYLVTIDQLRFMSIIMLMPVALKLARNNNFSFPKVSTDLCVLLYVLILVSLELRDTTFTDAMRQSFYAYTDILLPYYVMSRGVKNIDQLKTIAIAVVSIAIVIALIAMFEYSKGWLLYRSVIGILGNYTANDQVLSRAGSIRSVASLLQPIVLGYFMCIALGAYLFISTYINNKNLKRFGFLILALGLYAPVSRGPWVGATLMILVFLGLGPSAFKRLSAVFFCIILLLPTLTIIPGGEKFLNLIPFIGETEKSTITYRQELYKSSMIVIERNPIFGSKNYIFEPEMQSLKVNGIIDIVNTFIQVALETGCVGLCFFVLSFVLAIKLALGQMRQVRDKNSEYHILLRAMTSTLVGIIATIATVSSIGAVPILYWTMLGLTVASCEIVKTELLNQTGGKALTKSNATRYKL